MNQERAKKIISMMTDFGNFPYAFVSKYRPSQHITEGGISENEDAYVRSLMRKARDNFSFAGIIRCISMGATEEDIVDGHAHKGFKKVEEKGIYEGFTGSTKGQFKYEKSGKLCEEVFSDREVCISHFYKDKE